MKMNKTKKTIIAGAAALGLTLSGAGLSSVSAAGYPGHYVVKGSHGSNVTAVQKQLTKRGFSLANDGIFGPTTLKDVKAFQKKHQLSNDGIVGPKTWKALWSTSTHTSQILKMGSRGQAVKHLQEQLNKMGYKSGKADGIYGSMTKRAVVNFQKKHHLAVDGIDGPKTMKALKTGNSDHPKQERGTASVYIPTKTLKMGSRGQAVRDLQGTLGKMGYEFGGADGIYGPKTKKAIMKVQKKAHIQVDGIYGPNTRKAIEKIASGK